MLRVVAAPKTDEMSVARVLRPDPRRRLPGRGAWLHPVAECLDEAVRRRAFGRALRLASAYDASELEAYVGGRVWPTAADPTDGPAERDRDRKRV